MSFPAGDSPSPHLLDVCCWTFYFPAINHPLSATNLFFFFCTLHLNDVPMLADGEITPMRLPGKMVRFYLPDVLQKLREKAKTSKRNVGLVLKSPLYSRSQPTN
jgi:hypothetical protein